MIADRDAAQAFLYGRINYERMPRLPYRLRAFSLDRMRSLLRGLGDPQSRYPIVHVAGTKGKGSTSAMIAAMLSAAGYRTGLYTSPHLDCVEERWRVDGEQCSGAQFVELMEEMRPRVEAMDGGADPAAGPSGGPTFFEITTAAALLHFAREEVDAVVLEVGLGGRLDSTNVCQPVLSVITSISFDHTRQLGNTLAAIAGEKAGIVKRGVPVVTGVTEQEPWEVIERVAQESGSRCLRLGRDFDFRYGGIRRQPTGNGRPGREPMVTQLDFLPAAEIGGGEFRGVRVGLAGFHQAQNAAVSLAAIGELRRQGWRIADAAIRGGLETVRVPARFDVLPGSPPVVVDVAHNVASIGALVSTLEELEFSRPGRRLLVFGSSSDKDTEGMLELLLNHFDTLVLTRYLDNPRAVPLADLLDIARRLNALRPGSAREILVASDPAAAWSLAKQRAASFDLICIAGSFFLAAEMRRCIEAQANQLPSSIG